MQRHVNGKNADTIQLTYPIMNGMLRIMWLGMTALSFFFVSCIPHRPSSPLVSSKDKYFELPQNSYSKIVIRHSSYTISFNPQTLIANWVAYELTAEETDGSWTRKGLNFMPDPDYDGIQADHSDYRGSG